MDASRPYGRGPWVRLGHCDTCRHLWKSQLSVFQAEVLPKPNWREVTEKVQYIEWLLSRAKDCQLVMVFCDSKSPQKNLWEWSSGEEEGGEMAGARPEVEEFMCKICPKVTFLRYLVDPFE